MNGAGGVSNRPRSPILKAFRVGLPTLAETALTVASAFLTILAFPNFDFWFLSWISLAPLLFAVVVTRRAGRAFLLGWLYGTIFFYGTCWWLTYPMIRYGHISAWAAFPLLLLPVIMVALFPAVFCALLSLVIKRFGPTAIFVAPLIWIAIDWLRYALTGQLWNALGYS